MEEQMGDNIYIMKRKQLIVKWDLSDGPDGKKLTQMDVVEIFLVILFKPFHKSTYPSFQARQ